MNQKYYEAFEVNEWWAWRVYHWDSSGNKQIIVANGVEAELA